MFTLDLDFENDMDFQASTLPAVDAIDARLRQASIVQAQPQLNSQPQWGSAPESQHGLFVSEPLYGHLPQRAQRQYPNMVSADQLPASEQLIFPGQHAQHAQQHAVPLPSHSQWTQPSRSQSHAGFGVSPPLSSALRSSRGIPGVDTTPIAAPPVWVSGDGTPCTSPPVLSQTWGLSSMISIPEAAPSQAASKWPPDAACSLPTDCSAWDARFDSAGSPSVQHSMPHLVPQIMQAHLHNMHSSRQCLAPGTHYGSAPSASNAAAHSDRAPGSSSSWSGAAHRRFNDFGRDLNSGVPLAAHVQGTVPS